MKLKLPQLLQLALPLMALVLVPVVATLHGGIGVTGDSAAYIAAARNLLAGHGLRDYHGSIFQSWPPGYSLTLALFALALRLDPLAVAPLVNGLALAATFALALQLLERERVAGALALPWVMLGIPLIWCALMATSEMLFIALVLGWLVCLVHYQTDSRSRWWLAAALLAGLAGGTRYLGVSLIVAGGLLLVGRTRRQFGRAVGYGALASALPGVWLARNWLLTHTLTGPRSPSAFGLSFNVERMLTNLAGWFLPGAPSVWAAGLLALAVLALLGWALWRDRAALRDVRPALVLLAVYLVGMLASATLVAYGEIDLRLLAPIYLPLVWVLVRLARLAVPLVSVRQRYMVGALALVLALVSGRHVLGSSLDLLRRGEGWGGLRAEVGAAGAVGYLRGNVLAGPVYSNDPGILYLYTPTAAELAPGRRPYNSGEAALPVAALVATWPPAFPVYVVFFAAVPAPEFYTPDELSTVFEMEPVATWPDSGVYELRGLRP